MAAFQAHVGSGAVEGEGLGLGDATWVLCQGFGEGVNGFHQVQEFLEALTPCLRRSTHALPAWPFSY